MLNPTTCADSDSAIFSPGLGGGPSPCAALGGLTRGEFGRVLAPANLSARQARAVGLLTSGTFGPRSTGSSASSSLQSSLVNKLQTVTQNLGSTLYRLTWKPWVLPSGRSLSRLRASVPRISETAPIGSPAGWATPTARDYRHANALPWSERGGGKKGEQLNNQVVHLAGWPTPRREDGESSGARWGRGTFDTLTAVATHLAGWPTPSASDSTGAEPLEQHQARKSGGLMLRDAATLLPGPARLTDSGDLLIGSLAGMESGGQLSPEHSRWLMGYRAAWAACMPTETPSTLRRRSLSSSAP